MAFEFTFTNVNWNAAQLDYLLNNPAGPVGRDLARRGRKVLMAATMQVGVETGRLKKSLKMTHERNARGQFVMVGSKLNYALLHHEGSRPHIITPNRAQVLAFSSKGRVIYTTQVRHPGTKANRYLKDNLYLSLD